MIQVCSSDAILAFFGGRRNTAYDSCMWKYTLDISVALVSGSFVCLKVVFSIGDRGKNSKRFEMEFKRI